MAEITKITTPLMPKENIASKFKPDTDTAVALIDTTKVHGASENAKVGDRQTEQQRMLRESMGRIALAPLLKDTNDLTRTVQRMVSLLQTGIDASDVMADASVKDLLKALFVSPAQLKQSLAQQDKSSVLFKGEAFDVLRDLLSKFEGNQKIRDSVVDLLKTFEQNVNTQNSVKTILANSYGLLDYMFSKDRQQFGEYLDGLAEMLLPSGKGGEAMPSGQTTQAGQTAQATGQPAQGATQTTVGAQQFIGPEGVVGMPLHGQPLVTATGQPILDENGQPLMPQSGLPLTTPDGQMLLTPDGKPVIPQSGQALIDQNGQQIMAKPGEPLMTADGKPLVTPDGKPFIPLYQVVSQQGQVVPQQGQGVPQQGQGLPQQGQGLPQQGQGLPQQGQGVSQQGQGLPQQGQGVPQQGQPARTDGMPTSQLVQSMQLTQELGIDQREAAGILKSNLLPLLGEIVVKYNQNNHIRDAVMVVVHNIIRVDKGTPEALREAVGKLLTELKQIANLPQGFESKLVDALTKNIGIAKEAPNEVMEKLSDIVQKTLESSDSPPAAQRQAENLLISMLQNQSSLMNVLHFMLPVVMQDGSRIFAELYVDPDSEEKIGRTQSEQSRKFFLAFENEDHGQFELSFLQSGERVDFSMWCPKHLVGDLSGMKRHFATVMQLHGYTMNSFAVEEYKRPQSVAQVFPNLLKQKVGIDVSI